MDTNLVRLSLNIYIFKLNKLAISAPKIVYSIENENAIIVKFKNSIVFINLVLKIVVIDSG